MNQLQTVLDALEDAGYYDSAIAIIKQMMQAEPIYQYQMADGSWVDQIQASYEYNKRNAPNSILRVVYAAPQAMPAGFVLVPVEPTSEMCKAAREVPDASKPYPPHFHLIWDAMLAAAPKDET